MEEPIVMTMVAADETGVLLVLAPGVGWWSELPHAGALLGPGSGVGRLRRLTRSFRLVLPEGAAGRVSDGLPHGRIVAVEYGQTLFKLSPVTSTAAAEESGKRPENGSPLPGSDLPDGARAVVSPTDGVFYGRPSPEAPPFVEPGTRIRLGQPVGLVEVMKTFNQILYDGPGFPDDAEVLEVRVGDAEEVRAGQTLVVFR